MSNKARVQKNQAKLIVHSNTLNAPIFEAAITSFKAKSTTTAHKSRPMGYVNEGVTLKYGGYDLSFEIEKTNWHLAHFQYLTDRNLRTNKGVPEIYITETVVHYSGHIENWVYKNVSLWGLESSYGDEVSESIEGFASLKVPGPIDNTLFGDGTNVIRNLIFEVYQKVE